MPSLALPAVAPAIPVLPAAPAGAPEAALDAAQLPAAEGADASVFAAVLGRQMSAAASAAMSEVPLPAAEAAAADTQGDEAAPAPLDVAALLQGLMLPLAARPAEAAAADDGAAQPQLVEAMQNALTPRRGDMPAPHELPAAAAAAEQATRAAPDLRAAPAGELERAAIDAVAGGNTAESAAERGLAAAQTEAHAIQHPQPHAREMREAAREPLVVQTPVSSPKWHEDLGTKVAMLIGKDVSAAELVLTPPNLGRIEVELVVNGDQTSAVFVAASPAARDALEQALPKLREFLADAGIELSQASVGGETPNGRGRSDGQAHARGSSAADAASGGEAALAATVRRIDGMVDTFA